MKRAASAAIVCVWLFALFDIKISWTAFEMLVLLLSFVVFMISIWLNSVSPFRILIGAIKGNAINTIRLNVDVDFPSWSVFCWFGTIVLCLCSHFSIFNDNYCRIGVSRLTMSLLSPKQSPFIVRTVHGVHSISFACWLFTLIPLVL